MPAGIQGLGPCCTAMDKCHGITLFDEVTATVRPRPARCATGGRPQPSLRASSLTLQRSRICSRGCRQGCGNSLLVPDWDTLKVIPHASTNGV